ncbi:MAG: DEAD/DEAH box helicase family protein [bacterium]|nr:DEAD/DEAH box helicase family protein [bacterium]
MRYELFDYQREAAVGCAKNLVRGRRDWEDGDRSSFALSAITGAGKTVIATGVIEALIHGSADLGVDPDPRATFLWVTDDPALNRQTRNKMIAGSDLLQPARLVILDDGFMNDELAPGRVYFLNIQKLSKTAGLSRGGNNLRQHSFWDVLSNTIKGETTDLYVVLDEAHRGMKPSRGRKTIVQRIIAGKAGSNPPAPIVWGISATIDRFRAAMEGAADRTDYPAVQVDIDKVRASGLVKDEIGLEEPDEKGSFGSTLLREAVQATLDYERRWMTYSEATGEPVVLPALVLQVPDKASKNKLGELVDVIGSEWPGLGPHAIAHVFGEHEPIELGTRTLRWVHPESIQDDTDVRIVMAKTAISTGWDCPRAEVLYSERPASDATHIAQVVGRMVRQPLAHRIATDDALNSVACFLPKFDRSKLGTIKAELEGAGKANGEGALGAAVVRDPKVFERNTVLDLQVFRLIETLKGLPAPDILASPLRRARVLAQLLTDDKGGSALMPDAGQQLTKALNKRLDGLTAEYDEGVEENVEDIETGQIHRSRLSAVGEELDSTTREVRTHFADIDRDTRKIIKRIKEGAGLDYYAHRVEKARSGADKFEIRIEVAALLMIDEVVPALDAAATKWVQDRLEHFAVEVKNTTGATRNDYLRVQEQTIDPEPVDLILRDNVKTATRYGDGNPLPTFSGHLYADESGEFPVALNKWERTVVETEIARPSFVAWYRNPARPTAASLRIAYRTDAGDWTSLQPDFVVVSKRDDGSLGVSIIDPHGDHLADAKNKLAALARYAEQFGEHFVRIESITQGSDGTLRSLDLKQEPVRESVRNLVGAEVGVLYEADDSLPYK